MTQPISGSSAQKSEGFPTLNFGLKVFPVLFTATANKIVTARPRAFTFLSGAFSFFSGLALLKINDVFSNSLTQKVNKKLLVKAAPKPAIQAEEPIREEIKSIPVQETPVIAAPPVSMPKKPSVRTWSDRREQLLKPKV